MDACLMPISFDASEQQCDISGEFGDYNMSEVFRFFSTQTSVTLEVMAVFAEG